MPNSYIKLHVFHGSAMSQFSSGAPSRSSTRLDKHVGSLDTKTTAVQIINQILYFSAAHVKLC